MQETLNKISGYLIQYSLNVLAAILIFVIGKWVAKLVSQLIEKMMGKTKVNETLISFAKTMTYYAILVFVIIAALDKVGIQTNSFVMLIGAAGLAVGFALQGTLSNFAAGVMIIFFETFKTGDTIETSGSTGKVQEIQIFNTILYTSDNKKVIIPNSKITSDKLIIHKNG
jgi:small conductance mechanosensitive channel